MDTKLFTRHSKYEWEIAPRGKMSVPAIIYASRQLIESMDEKVYEQITNVAMLPGIVKASHAMPDAHWGYGFPMGGVAGFDPDKGGVISAGGVGFDISCGVRTLLTGLVEEDILAVQKNLASILFSTIPAGVGSTGKLRLKNKEIDDMLAGGAKWAIQKGYGRKRDLERTEEHGSMSGAKPEKVSDRAKKRQRDQMGTLGSGNHYLEVQRVVKIFDQEAAKAFGIREGEVLVSIHCGSRGLGHQIGTEFFKQMTIAAGNYGIDLPDKELACSPINSPHGQSYLGAMRAAINCALANRQILTHLTRQAFEMVLPKANLDVLYDVSHNTCKVEEHLVDGKSMQLYIHRKGATRALGPGHHNLPEDLKNIGQPVIIGGTMGTASYILVGTKESEKKAFSSACHGAGRSMSRRQAYKQFKGRQIIDDLAGRGIIIRSPSSRGVAEEAPGAYKDVNEVVDAADHAGLARKVAIVEPMICIKG